MARAHAGRLAAASLEWVADGSSGPLPAEIRALPTRDQAAIIRAATTTGNAARAAAERASISTETEHTMRTPSRRWDGQPETDADRRFFDLRESGYRGPIDQDGYAATSGEDAAILRNMAQRRGEDTSWWGTSPQARTGRRRTPTPPNERAGRGPSPNAG